MVIFEHATTHAHKKKGNFSSVLFLALNYLHHCIAIHGLLTILVCFVSFHVHVHVAANNLKRDARLPYIASLSCQAHPRTTFPSRKTLSSSSVENKYRHPSHLFLFFSSIFNSSTATFVYLLLIRSTLSLSKHRNPQLYSHRPPRPPSPSPLPSIPHRPSYPLISTPH